MDMSSGRGVQKGQKMAYVLNERPPTTDLILEVKSPFFCTAAPSFIFLPTDGSTVSKK